MWPRYVVAWSLFEIALQLCLKQKKNYLQKILSDLTGFLRYMFMPLSTLVVSEVKSYGPLKVKSLIAVN